MTNPQLNNAVSACVFGSVARGDFDILSDRDILVLAEDGQIRQHHKAAWSQKGWSVAAYSPRRLMQMGAAGNLFVQHIKQEGIVLCDPNKTLQEILSHYSPKDDYTEDFYSSLEMLHLIERAPKSTLLDFWSADVLYILIRNICILHLANERNYCFGFADISKTLCDMRLLSDSDVAAMMSLRAAKIAYRTRRFNRLQANESVEGALRVLEKLFSVAIERTNKLPEKMFKFEEPYFSLREAEKLLLCWIGLPEFQRSNYFSLYNCLWRLITDPRTYSWEIKKQHDKMPILVDKALAMGRIESGLVGIPSCIDEHLFRSEMHLSA